MIDVINNNYITIDSLDSNNYEQCIDLLTKSLPNNSYYDLHKKMNVL